MAVVGEFQEKVELLVPFLQKYDFIGPNVEEPSPFDVLKIPEKLHTSAEAGQAWERADAVVRKLQGKHPEQLNPTRMVLQLARDIVSDPERVGEYIAYLNSKSGGRGGRGASSPPRPTPQPTPVPDRTPGPNAANSASGVGKWFLFAVLFAGLAYVWPGTRLWSGAMVAITAGISFLAWKGRQPFGAGLSFVGIVAGLIWTGMGLAAMNQNTQVEGDTIRTAQPNNGADIDAVRRENERLAKLLETEREKLAAQKSAAQAAPQAPKTTPESGGNGQDASATPKPVRNAPSGTYFVILGSFKKNMRAQAEGRLSSVRAAGFSASIIDTNDYDNLADGYWSVALGPFEREEAKRLAREVKSVAGDAYVKSGW